jgi:hypothetical protein
VPTANGGTNLSSFTANGVVYASSTSALATGSALTFSGSVLNSTGTITAPNLQGPTFSSYLSTGQTIAGSTNTKVLFDTNLWNSGNFASSRFTPTIAGYYQVNLMVVGQNANTGVFTSIFKNGTAYKNAGLTMASPYVLVSGLVYLNGSTDYIEGYTYIIAATPIVSTASYFDACLVRS